MPHPGLHYTKRRSDEGLPEAVIPINCGIPFGGWPLTSIYVIRLWDRKFIGSQHLPPCRHFQPRHALVARGLVARCNGDIELNCLLHASPQLFFVHRGASSPLLKLLFQLLDGGRCVRDLTVMTVGATGGGGGVGASTPIGNS